MTTGERATTLKSNPVFAGLPAREIDALAAAAREDAYRAREYVFMEGDPARWLCVVTSGRVKIVRHSRTGKDVVLELLGPGEDLRRRRRHREAPLSRRRAGRRSHHRAQDPGRGPDRPRRERHPDIIKEMALMIGRRLRDRPRLRQVAVRGPGRGAAGRDAPPAGRARRRAHQGGAGPALPSHAAEPRRHDGHHGGDRHPQS